MPTRRFGSEVLPRQSPPVFQTTTASLNNNNTNFRGRDYYEQERLLPRTQGARTAGGITTTAVRSGIHGNMAPPNFSSSCAATVKSKLLQHRQWFSAACLAITGLLFFLAASFEHYQASLHRQPGGAGGGQHEPNHNPGHQYQSSNRNKNDHHNHQQSEISNGWNRSPNAGSFYANNNNNQQSFNVVSSSDGRWGNLQQQQQQPLADNDDDDDNNNNYANLRSNPRSQPTTTNQNRPRPNVLFLMSDQHRWDAMGSSGNSVVRTPNLDR